MSALLDLLGNVGYVADTPGAYLRGALAGNFGGRSSGEELLNSYGVDGGPIGGMAAEMALDPLALIGPAFGAYKGAKAVGRGLGLLDEAPLARRLAELAPKDPLTRRLGQLHDTSFFGGFDELGGHMPPLDLPEELTSAPRYAFSTRPYEGSTGGVSAILTNLAKNKVVGEVNLGGPGSTETLGLRNIAKKLGQAVEPGDTAGRVFGSDLAPGLQGRGIGQQLYLNAMNASDTPWFYNSGNSDAATHAINALRDKGLSDVFWDLRPGWTSGPRIQRITDAGREAARTNALAQDFLRRTSNGRRVPTPDLTRAQVGLPFADEGNPLLDAIKRFMGDEAGAVRMPGEPGWDEAIGLWNQHGHLSNPKGIDNAFADTIDSLNLPRDVADTLYQIRDNVHQYGKPSISLGDRLGSDLFNSIKRFAGDEEGALKPWRTVDRNALNGPLKLGPESGPLPWERAVQMGNEAGIPTKLVHPDDGLPFLENAVAWHTAPPEQMIGLNGSDSMWKNNLEMNAHNFEFGPQGKRIFASDHPDAVMNHELGHALHLEADPQGYLDRTNPVFRQMGAAGVDFLGKNLSKYATKNHLEAVAELVSALKGGESFPSWSARQQMVDLIYQIGGGKLWDILGDHKMLKPLGYGTLGAAGLGLGSELGGA